jgi:hypothetical protein
MLAFGLCACADVDVEPKSGDSYALSSPLDVMDPEGWIDNKFADTSRDLCPHGFVLNEGLKEPSDLEWSISCLQPVAVLPSQPYAAR